jgi:integrase
MLMLQFQRLVVPRPAAFGADLEAAVDPGLDATFYAYALRHSVQAFRVALGEGLAYWTVLDASLWRVPDLDAFLFYLRSGRGRAEATTEAYARALAVFEGWRCGSGRDRLAAVRDLHLFVASLRLSPIERRGRGFGGRRSNKRVNHVLAAVRSFYRFAVTAGRVPDAVLPLLWEVAETRHLPEELKPEGGGVRYRAQPRHQLRAERSVSPAAVTLQEATALLGAAEHWRDRLLIALLWHCGVRIGAALGLRRSDLHLMDDARALGCEVRGPHLHVIPRDNPNRARAKTTSPFTVPVRADVVAVYEMYLIERAAIPAARVNLSEADIFTNHCVVAVSSCGLLIHAAVGSSGGSGGLRTKRSGCSAKAASRTPARCWRTASARP